VIKIRTHANVLSQIYIVHNIFELNDSLLKYSIIPKIRDIKIIIIIFEISLYLILSVESNTLRTNSYQINQKIKIDIVAGKIFTQSFIA
jgi:hypothetical protein